MIKNLDKKYKCSYCSQTSSRKYNIDIHIQRKHQVAPANHSNKTLNPYFSNSFSQFNHQFSYDLNSSTEQPSSFFSPVIFYPNYNDDDAEEEKERRSRRRFDRTALKYIQTIVIPQLNSTNSPFNNIGSKLNIYPFIDPKKMPKSHKIYKCSKCNMSTLNPFVEYQNIYPMNEFSHGCINLQKYEGNNDLKIQTLKLQQLLLSVIDIRLKSENILLKMIVFPNYFIENFLCMKITKFFIDILGDQAYRFNWIFKLLENEKFVDLGEINADHWARRACDSTPENVTILEKEELKQFISIMEATFGLITFKINKKTIYTFSYIPLSRLQKEF
jgi:hypothetical protein